MTIFISLGQPAAILQVLCFVVFCVGMSTRGVQASSSTAVVCARFESAWWVFIIKGRWCLSDVGAVISVRRQKFLKLPIEWLPNRGSGHAALTGMLSDTGAFKISMSTNTWESGCLKIPPCSPQFH